MSAGSCRAGSATFFGLDGLADVDKFTGAFADDMYAENLARIAMKDQFETACGVSANLPTRCFAIEGHTNLVGHVFIRELFFGFADEADLGNRVDAIGVEAGIG